MGPINLFYSGTHLNRNPVNIIPSKYGWIFKGIVSPDWKGLRMVSLDRFEV
jgi:hypothetical protein